MKYVINFISVYVMTFTLLLFIGCSAPEGDDLYVETFTKMTMKEKILYDKCADVWGYSKGRGRTDHLDFIREAIRQRKVKPTESAMPFIDIKDIIISTNDTVLTHSYTSKSTIETYDGAKFDKLDPEWYASLIATDQMYNEGGDQSRGDEIFKFSNDLLLDCERKRGGGDSKVILYIGRKLYYVAKEDEWGDYKAISCGGDK
jgi:hypothetical protein